MIVFVADPPARRRVTLADGSRAILVEHGPMFLYAFGLEVRYEGEVETVPEGRPPGARRRAGSQSLGARRRRRAASLPWAGPA